MKVQIFRQGDVLLTTVRHIPVDAKRLDQKERIVLAHGEVTGHAHAIHDLDSVDVFVAADGTMYLSVRKAAALKHEEHGTIMLQPGKYKRVIQREYSPMEIRNVAD